MDIQAIIAESSVQHQRFTDFVGGLSEKEFLFQFEEKWTPGQQLVHVLLSIKALQKGLSMPKLVLRTTIGVAKKPSMSYEELVEKYQNALKEGGKAPSSYVPKPVAFEDRERLISRIHETLAGIDANLNARTEQELDQLRLPHPLIGKLTLREMVYFTIYHVQHHQKNIENMLNHIA